MKRLAGAIGIAAALLILITGAPVQAATVSFEFLDDRILPNESFQIEVFAQADASFGDLTAFGFNVDPDNLLEPITFDGYLIGPDYDDEGGIFPVDVAGSKIDPFTSNAGDNVLLATLEFTAGAMPGIYPLEIEGLFDSLAGSGGFYENFDADLVGTTDVNVVPIPAAAWLLVSGLLGIIGVRRYKTGGNVA
ncbi:MAG TPA: VPLPA-CTERM sorting domain-containing protein [Desulfobacterales bacterium]